MLISKQRVYLTEDRTKAVPDGHKEARTLLVAQGAEINEDDAAKYPGAIKLVKGGKEQPEAVAPDGPNIPVPPAASVAPAVPPKAKAAGRTVKIKQGR